MSGVLLSVVFTGALLSLTGISVHDMYIYAFSDNFGPGSVTDHPVTWKLNNFSTHFFSSELVLFLPGLIGYFLIKERNNIFVTWLICELIAITVVGTYSPQHFKDLLPSLSLINAFSIVYLMERSGITLKHVMIVLWISFFPKSMEPVAGLKQLFLNQDKSDNLHNANIAPHEDDYAKKILGLWIRSNTALDTKVVVAGYGAIAQAYSERLSSSNYFNVTQTKTAKETYFKEISLNKPGLVFVPNSPEYAANTDTDMRDFVARLVSNDYYFDRALYGYNMYRIKNGKGS